MLAHVREIDLVFAYRHIGWPIEPLCVPVNSGTSIGGVEHDNLFAALLAGKPYNEGDYGATSTMTAIMGRMATYSGRVVSWDEAINSQLDLAPDPRNFDAEPPISPRPDGTYACAMPGVTQAL